MCNFCQTNPVFYNTCWNNRNTGWRVQSICQECNGSFRIIVTNGCVCRRLHCNVFQGYQDFGETNITGAANGFGCRCGYGTGVVQVGCTQNALPATNGNGCGYGGCTATRFACAQNTVTAQNGDAYYARLYGLNTHENGRSCGCGCNNAL